MTIFVQLKIFLLSSITTANFWKVLKTTEAGMKHP